MSRAKLWLGGATGALLLVVALVWTGGLDVGLWVDRLLGRQDGTWAAMQERGSWRVGMDPSFPPFNQLDEQGAVVGYDADLARAIAEAWGLELEIVPLGYDSLLDALKAGRIDSVVSAVPYDPRGTRDYGFSPAYFEAGVRLAVRAGSPITGVAALPPAALVAVEWGSMGDMVGRRLQRAGTAIQLSPYATPDEAVAALAEDPTVTALLVDQVSLRQAQGRGLAIQAVGPALESNPYVIVAPLTATVLRERIATALADLQTRGAFTELEARWFGPLPTPVP